MVIPPEFRPTGGIAIDSEARSWAAASGSWIGYDVVRYRSSPSDYDYLLELESLKDRMECNADFGNHSVRIISGWDEKGIFLTPGQKYVVKAVWPELKSDLHLSVQLAAGDQEEVSRLLAVLQSVRISP